MDRFIEHHIEELEDLLEQYEQMFNDGNNDGDIIIVCEDGEIKVHSYILKTFSKYYKKLIQKKSIGSVKKIDLPYDSGVVCAVISIMYNTKYKNIYFDEYDGMCDFFEIVDFLMLDSIFDDKLNEIYKKYLKSIKKGYFVCDVNDKRPISSWIDILIYINNKNNKYFNQLRNDILSFKTENIVSSYINHEINILESNECHCMHISTFPFVRYSPKPDEKINCIFDANIIPENIIKILRLKALKNY